MICKALPRLLMLSCLLPPLPAPAGSSPVATALGADAAAAQAGAAPQRPPASTSGADAQAGALGPLSAQAAATLAQAIAQTRQQMQVPAAARVEIVPGTLDPRLKLAPCAQIEPYLPSGSRAWGRTRVGLRCTSGPVRWNVYLPLTVHVWAQAAVSSEALPAGTVLRANHVRLAEIDLAAVPGRAFTSPQELMGRSVAWTVPAGTALGSDMLRQRQWFQAGDTVTVLARGKGFAVAGEAQALSNGVEGQTVRLRTEGGRIITAVPTAPRQVELML